MNLIDSDKKILLNEVNRRGFILEDKVLKIIDSEIPFIEIRKGQVIDFDKRVEIDIFLRSEDYCAILECKRTDYTWIFARESWASGTLNFIRDTDQGVKIRTRPAKDFIVVNSDMTLMFDDNGRIKTKNRSEVHTSFKEIRDHINQVLEETEALLSTERFVGKVVFPIIVTNAKLLLIEYSSEDIDLSGDLIKYQSLEEKPYLVYNFPRVLRWDGKRQIIQDSSGTHMKSVIIVNVNHFKELMNESLQKLNV